MTFPTWCGTVTVVSVSDSVSDSTDEIALVVELAPVVLAKWEKRIWMFFCSRVHEGDLPGLLFETLKSCPTAVVVAVVVDAKRMVQIPIG